MLDTKKMRTASHLLPDPGGEVVRELLDEVERLTKELHEARAWTLGPAILAHSKDAILSAARHLEGLSKADPTPCTLQVAARLLEKFAFKNG